jgi:trans-aconitate methyltransferase
VLSSLVNSLSLPSSAIFQWLDSHVQVRLSILCAYLFGKSQLFVQLLRWLGHAWALTRAGLEPVFSVLGCALPLMLGWH